MEKMEKHQPTFQKPTQARTETLRNFQLRLDANTKDISAQVEQLRESDALLHREQTGLRVSMHENVSAVSSESRAVVGQMKAVESTLLSREQTLDRLVYIIIIYTYT